MPTVQDLAGMTVQAWALLRVIAAAWNQAAARILPVASRPGMEPGTREASTVQDRRGLEAIENQNN